MFLTKLYLYLLRAAQPEVEVNDVRTILEKVAGPHGQEDIVNAAEQLIEQGRVEGRAEGLRVAMAAVLAARAIQLSELGRARLAACVDVAVLTRWHTRAVTALTEAEVFASDELL